jgi:O-methyltransferase
MRDEPRLSQGRKRVFSGWKGLREPRAAGPGPDAGTLRRAYLDILKLCLCDLGGTATVSVWKDEGGTVMSRELTGEDLRIRAVGVDWPLHGMTMSGLARLDDLQGCVERVVAEEVAGDVIEAGAWRGGASILARATLDTLGDDRTVWVADSFEGFPVPDERHPDPERLAEIDFLAAGLDDVKANFARFGCEDGVRFVPGFFEQTMPGLADHRWAIVRLDGDSYEATRMTLQSLYPGLSVGGYLIVDDYGALEHCRRAVDEFRDLHGIAEPLEEVDWTCYRWRRSSDRPIEQKDARGAGATTNGRHPARVVSRTEDTRIPTFHELQLEREWRRLDREKRGLEGVLVEQRERLAAAEAEIGALHGSPLLGPKIWLRRKLRRQSGSS